MIRRSVSTACFYFIGNFGFIYNKRIEQYGAIRHIYFTTTFIFAFLPLSVVTVIVALPAFLAVSLPVFLLTATTFGLEDVKDLRSVQPFGPILTVACAVVFFFMVSVGFVNLTLVASM